MNILYWSSHAILEFDEVKLLTEMGYNVISLGAYLHNNKGTDMRGEIPNLYNNEHLRSVAIQSGKYYVHQDLIDWMDVALFMHNAKTQPDQMEQPEIASNWKNIKYKRVIFRSIGQSVPAIENELKQYRSEGLQIVRYSPKERNIPGYAGEDAIIRFYKDPDEYTNWSGEDKIILNFSQSMKQRKDHCGYNIWEKTTNGYPRKVYGPGNEDLKTDWGGIAIPEEQKKLYKKSRCYFYYGTTPASYTLTTIEAIMTGIPMIVAGKGLHPDLYKQDTYEMEDFIQNGQNGFISNDVGDLRRSIDVLMNDYEGAKKISENSRQTAIQLFGRDKIAQEWNSFLGG